MNDSVTGRNFYVDDGHISFFSVVADRISRREANFAGVYDPVELESLMPLIESLFGSHECPDNDSDYNTQANEQVAMVVMSPHAAVIHYLNGGFTAEQLAQADITDDHIDIQSVRFGSQTHTLRIRRLEIPHIALADADGNLFH